MGDLRSTYSQSAPLNPANHNLVGVFLRARREAAGISQRALGQLFEPAVTTQFISNIERGVTPLPPVHIPVMVRALKVDEADLLSVLEREYAMKLTQHFGRAEVLPSSSPGMAIVRTGDEDRAYFQALYDAFARVDPNTRDAFLSLCETLLKVPKPNLPKRDQSS